MNSKYSIVWQQFGPSSFIAKFYNVFGKEGAFPFFIEGENLKMFECGKKFPPDNSMLLIGILLAYSDNSLNANTDKNKELMLSVLPNLAAGFKYESVEIMILRFSCYFRKNFSLYTAYTCLKNGLLIEPDSSKIKSYFILTIFDIWKDDPDNGYDYMDNVIENFYPINMLDIEPQSIELVVYTTFVSVYFKSPDKISDFREKYCNKYMYHRVLKDKIKYLLDNKDSLLKDALY